jgi:hypothetical protein
MKSRYRVTLDRGAAEAAAQFRQISSERWGHSRHTPALSLATRCSLRRPIEIAPFIGR